MKPHHRPLLTHAFLVSFALLSLAPASAQTPEIPKDAPLPPPASAPESAPETSPPKASSEAPQAPAPTSTPSAVEPLAPVPAVSENEDARLAPSIGGETGLLRTAAASGPGPGALRLSLGIDFFAAGSMFKDGDSASRVGGVFGVSGSPFEHLELWLNVRAQSTHSSLARPELLQALGDLALGAKGYYAFGDGAHTVGADLQLSFLPGVDSQTFDFGATQFRLRALYTADLSRTSMGAPVRAHLNLGGIFDGSGSLVSQPISDAARFAYSSSEFDRFTFGLGLEVPVRYVTLFLEYGMEVPLGYLATPGIALVAASPRGLRPAQGINNSLASDPARAALPRVMPQRLTPGVRLTAIPDLTIDFAVEIGLTPETAPGVVAVPPYNIVFLFSYALDPFRDRGPEGPPVAVPVVVRETVEPPPSSGLLTGRVLNKDDKQPIEGVVVSFDRAPPVATADNGRFLSHEIEPGVVKLTARKDGFEPAIAEVKIEVGATQDLELSLTPAVREGTLEGRITDGKSQPIAGAALDFAGPKAGQALTDGTGAYKVELPEGDYLVMAAKDGFYRTQQKVKLEKGKSAAFNAVLKSKPTPALVELSGKAVKLSRKFAFGKDGTLTQNSQEIALALADLMLGQPGLRLKVEAHTDNSQAEADAARVTQAQANAIVAAVVSAGIGADRLAAVGVGSARPTAPNLTQRGRDQNRRVEISVLE